MDSLFFLLGVASIAVIVQWVIRNDKAPPDGATSGLLSMRQESVQPEQPVRRELGWRPPGR